MLDLKESYEPQPDNNISNFEYTKGDLVSIITPCYNSSRLISQTIDSVLSQTYQNWEMIIVDDCSTDNSVDIVEKYAKKIAGLSSSDLRRTAGQRLPGI